MNLSEATAAALEEINGLKREPPAKSKFGIGLVGRKFGTRTVTKWLGFSVSKAGHRTGARNAKVECVCDCGYVGTVGYGTLLDGHACNKCSRRLSREYSDPEREERIQRLTERYDAWDQSMAVIVRAKPKYQPPTMKIKRDGTGSHLVGVRKGASTVVRVVSRQRRFVKGSSQVSWRVVVRCDCGNEREVWYHSLSCKTMNHCRKCGNTLAAKSRA